METTREKAGRMLFALFDADDSGAMTPADALRVVDAIVEAVRDTSDTPHTRAVAADREKLT
ncbi:MAG TPA: hypothetical protein VKR23_15965 [Gaiellaceae bacterium]|nr:hypothetical protein [Gaiellaceae bacterium]